MIRSDGEPIKVETITGALPKRLRNIFDRYAASRERQKNLRSISLFPEDFETLARYIRERYGRETPTPTIETATWHGLPIIRFAVANV